MNLKQEITLSNGANIVFPWNDFVTIHRINGIDIVESVNVEGEHKFHPYVDGKDTMHSFNCLDAAVVYAIAYKYEGRYTSADIYFRRAIGMDEKVKDSNTTDDHGINKILATSNQWNAIYENIVILDPDGWDRKNFQYSWYEEKISLSEFMHRVELSTIKLSK